MVDEVANLKCKITEEGATSKSEHFYVQNKPRNDSKGTSFTSIIIIIIIIIYLFYFLLFVFQQECLTKLVTYVLLRPS